MPIFEYRCDDCGSAFEAFVTAERVAACPSCQGRNLAKLLSVPGMVGGGEASRAAAQNRSFPAGSCGAGGAGCPCRTN